MGLPPSQSLWVGMLLLVVVLVVELPGSLQRCIFDEVQTQVSEVTPRPPTGPEHLLTSGKHSSHSGWRRRRRWSPLPGYSVLGEVAPPTPAPPQPIRIHTWVTRESDDLRDTEKVRLMLAVEEAVWRVSSLLSVNRSPGPLLLSRDINKYCRVLWSNSRNTNYNRCGRANSSYRNETCLDVTIPDDHLAGCDIYPEPDSPHRTVLRPAGAGVSDTDFLLYLHIQSTDRCRAEPDVLAYAVHCQTDTSGRPVAGVVVMCRDRVTADTTDHQTIVQTVIHELIHALGFSKHLFHTWRDCSSSSQVGVGCFPRRKVIHSDGSGQMRIYTPSVISALQNHLVSTDPELGGPLENLDAAAGKVSSHWESRVLRGSIMAAVLEDWTTVRIDPVTLAALQDTGWYTVNLSRTQSLVWGSGEGATFGSVSTCHDNSSSFFCTGSERGCHFLHLHKGECQTDLYLEGCRVFKPLKNASECWRKENTRQPAEDDLSGEMWGSDSRCFLSSLNRQTRLLAVNSSVEGRCYRHRCTGPNRYQVQVSGSEWVDCPAGGATQIKGFQGLVFCPDRRLCLYPDITPPSHGVRTSPASNTSELYETFTSVQDWTWSLITAATALSSTAALCVLVALMVSHRKRVSSMVRIHTETQHRRMQP